LQSDQFILLLIILIL